MGRGWGPKRGAAAEGEGPDGGGGGGRPREAGAAFRTRRYHGLLVVATRSPGNRMLGLADLDAILVVGERRIPLGVHEWASGVIDPTGYIHLEGFTLEDGLPRWRWAVGDVVVERTVAMMSGRSAVAIVHRIVRAPQAVGLQPHPLCPT